MSQTTTARHDAWNQPVIERSYYRKVILWGREFFLPKDTPLHRDYDISDIDIEGERIKVTLKITVFAFPTVHAGTRVSAEASFVIFLAAKPRGRRAQEQRPTIEDRLNDPGCPTVTLRSVQRLVRMKVWHLQRHRYGLNTCLAAMIRQRNVRLEKIRRLVSRPIPIR